MSKKMNDDPVLVNRIKELRSEGKTFSNIAKLLKKEGFVSPNTGKSYSFGGICSLLMRNGGTRTGTRSTRTKRKDRNVGRVSKYDPVELVRSVASGDSVSRQEVIEKLCKLNADPTEKLALIELVNGI